MDSPEFYKLVLAAQQPNCRIWARIIIILVEDVPTPRSQLPKSCSSDSSSAKLWSPIIGETA